MDLTLTLSAGSLSGSVVLWDSVGGAGANAQHDGARVAITGTSFNGLAWTPPPVTTASPGTWQLNPLPPGTYDVTLTSAGRTCETYGRAVVGAGAAIATGPRRCTDAIAPGAVGLGSPLPSGAGISGWVSGLGVTIPIAAAATDATAPATNLRGYQTVLGAAPSWAAATLVPVAPVAPTGPWSAGSRRTRRTRCGCGQSTGRTTPGPPRACRCRRTRSRRSRRQSTRRAPSCRTRPRR